MTKIAASDGTVHSLPDDLKKVLIANPKALEVWEDITPLARNEWICLVESSKQSETRTRRIERTRSQLISGKRRPCCWIGCIHRKGKSVSPSVQWALAKQTRKAA